MVLDSAALRPPLSSAKLLRYAPTWSKVGAVWVQPYHTTYICGMVHSYEFLLRNYNNVLLRRAQGVGCSVWIVSNRATHHSITT